MTNNREEQQQAITIKRNMIIKTAKYRLSLLTSLYLLLILSSGSAIAEKEKVPEQIEGAKKVSSENLITLAETLPELIIIDARITKDRTHGYIEGSISLPNTKTDCSTLSKVVKTLNTPTVYYCNGPKCGRSVKSIHIALKCGYNNIYWYRGGFEDWKEQNYPFAISDQ